MKSIRNEQSRDKASIQPWPGDWGISCVDRLWESLKLLFLLVRESFDNAGTKK